MSAEGFTIYRWRGREVTREEFFDLLHDHGIDDPEDIRHFPPPPLFTAEIIAALIPKGEKP